MWYGNEKRLFDMSDIEELTEHILQFRDVRDWQQFHNPKDMAISLVLEATEFLEHFQWKNDDEVKRHIEDKKLQLGEELADVLYWVLLLSSDLNIDLKNSFLEKMKKNREKYPINKAKGTHKKYTELRQE